MFLHCIGNSEIRVLMMQRVRLVSFLVGYLLAGIPLECDEIVFLFSPVVDVVS